LRPQHRVRERKLGDERLVRPRSKYTPEASDRGAGAVDTALVQHQQRGGLVWREEALHRLEHAWNRRFVDGNQAFEHRLVVAQLPAKLVARVEASERGVPALPAVRGHTRRPQGSDYANRLVGVVAGG